jgi:predicted nucleic acid-binding Zn ribbon protein
MWITLAVAAIGAGIQLFGQVMQNNALKREATANLTQAEANTELGVLKADAYLGALAKNAETQQSTEAEKARIEANQQRLRTVAIIAAAVLAFIIAIVLTVKARKS